MTKIYGVSFKDKGKIYNFKSDDLDIPKNVTVVVETEKGLQFGKVLTVIDNSQMDIDTSSMKEILRISTKEDYVNYQKNISDAEKALSSAKSIALELGLVMTLLDASYTFDRKQLLFNFTADERVDFRELAKRLAGMYRTRIELRQIGARDKSKEVGGIGQCGLCLCCNQWLNKIDSITMNMAKNQNIALNPSKINGQCGRLLCCLTYENDEYTKCQKDLPELGQSIKTFKGYGRVISVDVLNRKYTVDIDGNKEIVELKPCEKVS